MSIRIGVDTGGTFTDFVCVGTGGLIVQKLRSTPDDPSRAILAGVDDLSPRGRPLDIVHGSTVATNAVLERKGARVALVTTEGFEDVIRIGRQTRPELYNFFAPARRAIVEPELTFGIRERMDAGGAVLVEIDDAAIDRLVEDIRRSGGAIAAVCLLHSYVNPAHERRIAARCRASGLPVSASSDILPEYREFERSSTTVVNAYVTPLIDTYLGALEAALAARARQSPIGTRLSIMQSNGGSISAAAARAQAVRTVLSGPAAGVVGARAVAKAAGFDRIISFDMGGTSTDVSLVDDVIPMTTDSRVGDFPVRLPVIDVHTVGAGGGSIAYIDSGGALRVGPRSAGAAPGPACYGTGTDLTVTDANLLLGRLDPEQFLGGRMRLDASRSRAAAVEMARRLKIDVLDLAEGVVRVANANMERAIRVVSVERGHDPRRFALLAFGGAGAMHACEIAERLNIDIVIAPRHAGVLSALGMLLADVTRDYSASVLRPSGELTIAALAKRFAPLLAQAKRELSAEGFSPARQVLERLVDVRYAGQSYEITVPFGADYRDRFDRTHRRLYGYSSPGRPTEVVAVRVKATGVTDKPKLPFDKPRATKSPIATDRRPGRFGARMTKVSFYRWDDLAPGARAKGPAVISGGEATIVVPPQFTFLVDGHRNVLMGTGLFSIKSGTLGTGLRHRPRAGARQKPRSRS